jgi:hypothetical protein
MFSKRTEKALTDSIGRVFEEGMRAERAECIKIIEEWRDRTVKPLQTVGPVNAVVICNEIVAAIRYHGCLIEGSKDEREQGIEAVPDRSCTCTQTCPACKYAQGQRVEVVPDAPCPC